MFRRVNLQSLSRLDTINPRSVGGGGSGNLQAGLQARVLKYLKSSQLGLEFPED